ncbi:ornithine cyclodeaminase [Ensifer sp. HO-A22]|uniref:Ornithine cyclodeaminase n=1 Tax=Ensifer oleiphilus TaxID=2742698 RepID=A0A7Y6UNI0_9HYPH|nr:ornithine cyclodeaminase [Ensifer oleiphilus]
MPPTRSRSSRISSPRLPEHSSPTTATEIDAAKGCEWEPLVVRWCRAPEPKGLNTVTAHSNLNIVPFVSVDHMMRLVLKVGIETFLTELAAVIEDDFRRWEQFDKTPRIASHSKEGVIELMPTSDGTLYGFKYVNGHPKNTKEGRQTVTAFGVLSDVGNGYPMLLSEMTILTALRTAAMSAVAAKHLARADAKTMAIIGNGAQSEFQALAFKAIVGVSELRLFDIDPSATERCARNLTGKGFAIKACSSSQEAVEGADIITTVTADKQYATILSDNMVGPGVHINAVGGDCPGKTELHKDILLRSDIFVEYPPQTRVEGEIQQLDPDYPVKELWEVIAGKREGRQSERTITLFDSVGFAIEDFSALRYVRSKLQETGLYIDLDLLADPDEPRDLYGMLLRCEAKLREA